MEDYDDEDYDSEESFVNQVEEAMSRGGRGTDITNLSHEELINLLRSKTK